MVLRLFLMALLLVVPGRAQTSLLQARVDPRVELVAIVSWLAELPEYGQCRSPEYLRRLRSRFEPYRGHPAVAEAKRLAQTRWIRFGAPVSLALHLDASFRLLPEARPAQATTVIPGVQVEPVAPGGTLDFRWTRPVAASFSALLRDFADASGFTTFMEEERSFHAISASGLTALAASLDLAWIRQGTQASFTLVTSPMLGPNNYGPSLPGAGHAAVLGVPGYDADGRPKYSERTREVLVHELLHPLVNPRLDRWMSMLRPSAERLAAARPEDFKKTGYAGEVFNPDFLYESVVRSLEVVYAEQHGGPEIGAVKLKAEIARGWTWLPDLTAWAREAVASGKFTREDPEAFAGLAAALTKAAGVRAD